VNNNDILRSLRYTFDYGDDDMIDILQLADFRLSKPELSAFFRNSSQSQYRPCKDQVMRVFLQGLRKKFRP